MTGILFSAETSLEGGKAMENKDTYTLQELFDYLPITLGCTLQERTVGSIALAHAVPSETDHLLTAYATAPCRRTIPPLPKSGIVASKEIIHHER